MTQPLGHPTHALRPADAYTRETLCGRRALRLRVLDIDAFVDRMTKPYPGEGERIFCDACAARIQVPA